MVLVANEMLELKSKVISTDRSFMSEKKNTKHNLSLIRNWKAETIKLN